MAVSATPLSAATSAASAASLPVIYSRLRPVGGVKSSVFTKDSANRLVAQAFKSSFAIVRHPSDTRYKDAEENISIEAQNAYNAHYNRCMEIIYALNTDKTFRNLLQYGHLGTNYSFDQDTETVIRYTEGAGVYNMNLLYTGDVFSAYYCPELNWTVETYNNGINQNKEAVVPSKE